MPTTGTVHLNGKPYDDMILKAMSGYVMQDDLMHAYLTVHETLMYTALLRMPKNTTKEERENREKEVLELMGIGYTKDVIIGDSRHKGVSGGERKRVAVAVELLTKPKLLFLDEPTSGLDSTSALALVKRLKEMVDRGMCTIVCTIHQPQSKIFSLFDNLILMKKGNIVYQGQCSKVLDYFTSIGHPCPALENPADHFMDVISSSNDNDKGKGAVLRMNPPVDLDFGAEKQDFLPKDWPLWLFQFYVLLRRNLKEWKLRWYIIALNVLVTSAVSLFICMGAWYQIGIYQDSVPKRNAILFFCVIHQGVVASLQGTYSFPLDRAVFLRERAAGTYYVSSYYVAKFFTDMLVQVPIPILFSCIIYPTIQLSQVDSSKMLIFIAISVLCSQSCTALSNMMSCIFVSIEMSTVALAFCLEITRLYSGFFISPILLLSNSQYYKFKFVDAISYMKYSYVGYVRNEYTGLILQCLPGQLVNNKCPITRGEQISAQYGYDQYTVEFCCWMLVVYIFLTRFVGYLALKYITV
jgi:ATP-binding cassette subfamily G (WHITE) protein 2